MRRTQRLRALLQVLPQVPASMAGLPRLHHSRIPEHPARRDPLEQVHLEVFVMQRMVRVLQRCHPHTLHTLAHTALLQQQLVAERTHSMHKQLVPHAWRLVVPLLQSLALPALARRTCPLLLPRTLRALCRHMAHTQHLKAPAQRYRVPRQSHHR